MNFIKIAVLILFCSTLSFSLSIKDLDKLDKMDSLDYASKAKEKANSEQFSQSYDFLKKASIHGLERSEYENIEKYIKEKKKSYEARLEHERLEKQKKEREEQARLQKQREAQQAQNQYEEKENLRDKCAIIIGNFQAYSACIKNTSALMGMGTRGLIAKYAIEGNCNYIAGIDSTGLSYLCSNPNPNGCIGLKASQDTINQCYNCGGSNLWLRVYAMGTVLQCF
jgi:alpha-galactosidase/6-phospho-beta-glucosidase family protein